jgi:spore coat polysaccharide biosynthesis protein SpsF (cytidylyltransferase family)
LGDLLFFDSDYLTLKTIPFGSTVERLKRKILKKNIEMEKKPRSKNAEKSFRKFRPIINP